MYIYNEFGITPTNTFVSAGTDYYIPNINEADTNRVQKALIAFQKSYKVTYDDLQILYKFFEENLKDTTSQITNVIHLFLALGNAELDRLKKSDIIEAAKYFMSMYLTVDITGLPGVVLKLNDTLFINSGIKVVLDSVLSNQSPLNAQEVMMLRNLGIGIAGLYVNKSGKGNAGFDVRACLVDEDYAGFVHLSMAYTKDVFENGQNIVYAGDKLVQMMLIPVFHSSIIEVNEHTYNELMSQSERGDSGFGSSDIKH